MKKQTKESFDAYLARVRKDADEIKSIPKFFKECPLCANGKPALTIETQTYVIPPYVWHGERYVYVCNTCKEGFTTTESDTMSIATLKIKQI